MHSSHPKKLTFIATTTILCTNINNAIYLILLMYCLLEYINIHRYNKMCYTAYTIRHVNACIDVLFCSFLFTFHSISFYIVIKYVWYNFNSINILTSPYFPTPFSRSSTAFQTKRGHGREDISQASQFSLANWLGCSFLCCIRRFYSISSLVLRSHQPQRLTD